METYSQQQKERLKDIYTDFVRTELGKLADDFFGTIIFEMKLRSGGISNLNVDLKKSIKVEVK